MAGGPAAVAIIIVEAAPEALWVVLHNTRANIPTFLRLLVSSNIVVELCVHDVRPVHRVKVAELRVFLNPNGTPCDVPQIVKADVLQAGHLKDHQGVVVEQVASPDDTEIGEQRAQAVQASHTEQKQIICDHCEFGEAECAELLVWVVVFISDEKDLQVAFHHRAVVQLLEFADVIADIDMRATDNWKK